MKPYIDKNWVPTSSVPLFIVFAVLLAILTGIAAYLISQIFYIFVLFAFGVVGLIWFWTNNLVRSMRIHHAAFAVVVGVIVGILALWVYHYIPFAIEKNEFVQMIVSDYQVTEAQAAQALDQYLVDETGVPGLLGYMKLVAMGGQEFSGFLMIDFLPIEMNYSINPFWVWTNWIVEAGIIIYFSALFFRNSAREPFDRKDKAWYGSLSSRVAAVPTADQAAFYESMQAGDLSQAIPYIVSDDVMEYPRFELAIRRSEGKSRGGLIFVRDSRGDETGQLQRTSVGVWELNGEEFASLEARIEELIPED